MGVPAVGNQGLAEFVDADLRRFLKEKWDLIEESFAPIHFVLFGSRVRGVPHEWSDIDLIVVSERFRSIPFVNRAYHFKKVVRAHVGLSALCYTPEEFEDLRLSPVGVVADACKEGVWLK